MYICVIKLYVMFYKVFMNLINFDKMKNVL
jgi:hypothetical protein